jgi:hypothetical protein
VQDKLADVLPHVPVSSAVERLVDDIVSDSNQGSLMIQSTPVPVPASTPPAWPKPLVALEEKKRLMETPVDDVLAHGDKKAKSPCPGTCYPLPISVFIYF